MVRCSLTSCSGELYSTGVFTYNVFMNTVMSMVCVNRNLLLRDTYSYSKNFGGSWQIRTTESFLVKLWQNKVYLQFDLMFHIVMHGTMLTEYSEEPYSTGEHLFCKKCGSATCIVIIII